jgi:four helix bundle protein
MINKIVSFTDLEAWKKGHEMVLLTYKHTRNFPKEELFVLTSQIRRAVISITSNIAEGFRKTTKKEKHLFYNIALGSCTEFQNQLLIARDLGYISRDEFKTLADLSVQVSKLLVGLQKKVS